MNENDEIWEWLQSYPKPEYGGEVEPLSAEELDEFFRQLGLDLETTEAVTLVGNTRVWETPGFAPHFWTDEELWDCEPFVGEEWLRYDPREGF
tara:strand:- start:960 stop:1238 length:279 start_codon:yes stop_codon:yes gene_type:complete